VPKGKEPKISKKDLQAFVDASTEKESLDVPEAMEVLGTAMSLLRSSSGVMFGDGLPEEEKCWERFNRFTERARWQYTYTLVKWVLAGGLISVFAGGFFLYDAFSEPIKLIYENRKILKLMGDQNGWEINESTLGYKTPWEAHPERYRILNPEPIKIPIKEVPKEPIKEDKILNKGGPSDAKGSTSPTP